MECTDHRLCAGVLHPNDHFVDASASNCTAGGAAPRSQPHGRLYSSCLDGENLGANALISAIKRSPRDFLYHGWIELRREVALAVQTIFFSELPNFFIIGALKDYGQ